MYFQHNKVTITRRSYLYVYEYKKQLLKNITKLLTDLDIKFVICYGNLIEYERKKPIYRDDDLDIIFNVDDILKWSKFCENNDRELIKYNLKFDQRFKNIKKQKFNGIQCQLINFKNIKQIKTYNMDIHCDLVANIVKSSFWPNLNINFDAVREITFYNTKTYAPSTIDTNNILINQYGENYLIPDTPNPFAKKI